jgi:hypothetical protein
MSNCSWSIRSRSISSRSICSRGEGGSLIRNRLGSRNMLDNWLSNRLLYILNLLLNRLGNILNLLNLLLNRLGNILNLLNLLLNRLMHYLSFSCFIRNFLNHFFLRNIFNLGFLIISWDIISDIFYSLIICHYFFLWN